MKRVLITEDDRLIAQIYRDSFEREGFSAEIAPDGAVAIQRLKGNPPDVVLLDLMLPNVNGVEVLNYIRSQDKLRGLPVIVMSNAFAGPLGQQATAAGATKMFAKNGCGPKWLVKEVQDVLAGAVPSPAEMTVPDDAKRKLADLRKEVTSGLPQRIAELRRLIEALAKDKTVDPGRLLEMHRAAHQVAGVISLAGFGMMSQLACALEALIKELHSKPQKLNSSSLRTAIDAVDSLNLLCGRTGEPSSEGISSPLILVVDDDDISRETTCSALELAHLRAVTVDDSSTALKLANENRFDLIFMDIHMPGMNGFELCEKIHGTQTNAKTPVVFVTSLNEMVARPRSAASGGMDFIAKPIVLVELAVKALTHLLKRNVKTV